MRWIELMVLCTLLNSCTMSMNMVSTKGTASDVIDETQSPTNDIESQISVPMSGL